MIAPPIAPGSLCTILLIAANPHGYWWVMRRSNPRPLPCEPKCTVRRVGAVRGESAFQAVRNGRRTAGNCTEIDTSLLTSCDTGCINSLVNVLARRDNPNEPYLSCVFQPLTRARWASTGSAAEIGLFAFQRRCFVVVKLRIAPTLRAQSVERPSHTGGRGRVDLRRLPGDAGLRASRHHKAPSGPKRHIDASTCPHVVGALHESDGAMSAPAPAALSQGPQRTGNADRRANGPRLTGAWKWNVNAQRAVALSSTGVAEGSSGASGLS